MNIEHKLVIDNDKQQVKFHLVNQVAKQVIPFSERKGYTAVKKCLKFVCLSVQANQNSVCAKAMKTQQYILGKV
jgi:hypothetical protein